MAKETTVRIACSACGKRYRVAAENLGRSATCTSCGERFRLEPAPDEVEAQTGTGATTEAPPSQRNGKQAGASRRSPPPPPRTRFTARGFAFFLGAAFRTSPEEPEDEREERLEPPCAVCVSAVRADVAQCPACGQFPRNFVIAYPGRRSVRIEAELRGLSWVALVLGLAAVGASPYIIVAAAGAGHVVAGLVWLAAGCTSAMGGVLGRRFVPPARIVLPAGLGALAATTLLGLGIAAPSVLSFGAVCWLLLVAVAGALPLLPGPRIVLSPPYLVAIRPEARRDLPVPFIPLVLAAIAATVAAARFMP
jgi:hypothetical protein